MSQCGNNNELALQHGGFCITWSLAAKGLLTQNDNNEWTLPLVPQDGWPAASGRVQDKFGLISHESELFHVGSREKDSIDMNFLNFVSAFFIIKKNATASRSPSQPQDLSNLVSVRLYMKYFIYWTADVKSSKLWFSQWSETLQTAQISLCYIGSQHLHAKIAMTPSHS